MRLEHLLQWRPQQQQHPTTVRMLLLRSNQGPRGSTLLWTWNWNLQPCRPGDRGTLRPPGRWLPPLLHPPGGQGRPLLCQRLLAPHQAGEAGRGALHHHGRQARLPLSLRQPVRRLPGQAGRGALHPLGRQAMMALR